MISSKAALVRLCSLDRLTCRDNLILLVLLIALSTSEACSARVGSHRSRQSERGSKMLDESLPEPEKVVFDEESRTDSSSPANQGLNASASDVLATLARPLAIRPTLSPSTADGPGSTPFQEHSTLLVRDYVKFTTKSSVGGKHSPAYDMSGSHHGAVHPPRHVMSRLLPPPFYHQDPPFKAHSSSYDGTIASAASNGDYVVQHPEHRGDETYSRLGEPRIVYYGDNVEYRPGESSLPPRFSYVGHEGTTKKFERRLGPSGRRQKCTCHEDTGESLEQADPMSTGYVPMLSPPEMKVDQLLGKASSTSSRCVDKESRTIKVIADKSTASPTNPAEESGADRRRKRLERLKADMDKKKEALKSNQTQSMDRTEPDEPNRRPLPMRASKFQSIQSPGDQSKKNWWSSLS